VLGLACDVSKDKEMIVAVDAIVRHFGGLDILVSNAVFFHPARNIADMSVDLG